MSLLQVRGGGFSRAESGRRRVIFEGIDLALERGEALSILGRNGAGKTTLIKCLLGFLKWERGASYLEGREFSSLSSREIWSKIAYVPQAKGAILNLSVLEMVVLGFNHSIRFTPSEAHFRQANEMLERLGIASLRNHACDSLSGGEMQMVLFARALVSNPSLLILDEPESNLDFANQKRIMETLREWREQGCAILFNTHFPAHARFLSDKVLLLYKGESARFGTREAMLNEENLSALYGVDIRLSDKSPAEYRVIL